MLQSELEVVQQELERIEKARSLGKALLAAVFDATFAGNFARSGAKAAWTMSCIRSLSSFNSLCFAIVKSSFSAAILTRSVFSTASRTLPDHAKAVAQMLTAIIKLKTLAPDRPANARTCRPAIQFTRHPHDGSHLHARILGSMSIKHSVQRTCCPAV